MPFVLDASIAAAWALADESSPFAEQAESRLAADSAIVPHIWWYEVRNILVVNERRRRITADESAAFLRILSAYPILIEPDGDEAEIFRIARSWRLSFYDAAYLALALRERLPLATLDRNLQAAAAAEKVEHFG
ncbi:MAG TPA: type II toxin-antitoxin system VapC family toxin [Terracidiphilus sp.]|nr:type II toxin-antitoxin system VapC family toxin [Terracidiphilus sp.]